MSLEELREAFRRRRDFQRDLPNERLASEMLSDVSAAGYNQFTKLLRLECDFGDCSEPSCDFPQCFACLPPQRAMRPYVCLVTQDYPDSQIVLFRITLVPAILTTVIIFLLVFAFFLAIVKHNSKVRRNVALRKHLASTYSLDRVFFTQVRESGSSDLSPRVVFHPPANTSKANRPGQAKESVVSAVQPPSKQSKASAGISERFLSANDPFDQLFLRSQLQNSELVIDADGSAPYFLLSSTPGPMDTLV